MSGGCQFLDLGALAQDDLSLSWRAAGDGTGLTTGLQDLSPDERRRFDRITHPGRRQGFLAGRVLLRQTLFEITSEPTSSWRFEQGPRGRPEVLAPASLRHIRFSLSHCRDGVYCGVSLRGGIGIDAETLDRRVRIEDLAARFFSPAERDDVLQRGPQERPNVFFPYWTLREAYLKARGVGVGVALAALSFHIDADGQAHLVHDANVGKLAADWHFAVLYPHPRHVVAVAHSG